MRIWRSRFIRPVFLRSWKRCAASSAAELDGAVCGRLLPIAAATVREPFSEVAIRLTQVGAVGSTEWGGGAPPPGGPRPPPPPPGGGGARAARGAAPPTRA